MMTLRVRRLVAWVALWALGLGAWVPVASQAWAALGHPPGWVQICTVSGMSWVRLDAAGQVSDDQAPESDVAYAGCTWCLGHGTLAPPPAPAPWVPQVQQAAAPAVVPASAVLAQVWVPLWGRAPPQRFL